MMDKELKECKGKFTYGEKVDSQGQQQIIFAKSELQYIMLEFIHLEIINSLLVKKKVYTSIHAKMDN